jgi:hypothetical protein
MKKNWNQVKRKFSHPQNNKQKRRGRKEEWKKKLKNDAAWKKLKELFLYASRSLNVV